jgi:putative protein-disulfide isomerase
MGFMERILWYFADPMCSWCWGFAPVIERIVHEYKGRLPISLIVGGLSPGTTQPLSADAREEVLHHWHEVNQMSGQAFNFDNALPEGFIYNTEPACRAAVTIPELQADKTMNYFFSLEHAFYREQRDITRVEVLKQIAEENGLDGEAFMQQWQSQAMHDKTQRNFQMTQQAGVRGFPTLILQDKAGFQLLTAGYSDYEAIQPELEQWLEQSQQRS